MAKYKFKLSEMSKTASPDDAEKELGTPKRKFQVGQITYSDDGTSSSEITNIDPVTGAVSWKITQLPGFEKLYDEMDDLVDVAKRVYVKTKDDKKFREFYENARKLRNSIRTHLRNEYPDQYKRITRIGEGDMDEVSMSGAAGAYLTPYAFRRKGQKADDEAYKELGYKPVKENFSAGGRSLGYYEEDDVNIDEIIDLVHVKEPDGSLYGTGSIVKVEKDKTWVRFDGDTIKKFDSNRVVPVQESQDPGARLGPGPKAGPDGVNDNYYVKAFKYKLVPKNKKGTYVQPPSTLPVRKLWK
tara:strand:+ start:2281 stop:3177 length:897 start_codon:yes stop_codon:yes gene_type:complete